MTTSPRPDPLPVTLGAATRLSIRRIIPLVEIGLATGTVLTMGWHRTLSFQTLARQHGTLDDFIVAHRIMAISAFIGLYVAVVGSDCRLDFDLGAAGAPELLAGLVALGMLAFVPILVKRVRARTHLAGRSG